MQSDKVGLLLTHECLQLLYPEGQGRVHVIEDTADVVGDKDRPKFLGRSLDIGHNTGSSIVVRPAEVRREAPPVLALKFVIRGE